jgi:hypothetical protein
MVEREADLIAIEGYGAVNVAHRYDNDLQGPVHDHFLVLGRSAMNCVLTITHGLSLISHPRAPAGFIAALTLLGYGGPQTRKLLADCVLRNLGKDEHWWTTSFALGFFLGRTPRRARP